MISSIYETALNGLQRNQIPVQRHAHRINQEGTVAPEEYDLPTDVVGLMTTKPGFEANLAVPGRADEMVGTLIDIPA